MYLREIVPRDAADAMIESIANQAAPARFGRRNQQRYLMLSQILIHVEEADARLDQRISLFLVYFQNPIHPFQIEHYCATHGWAGAPVPEIAAG